jgi:hypothetical protein
VYTKGFVIETVQKALILTIWKRSPSLGHVNLVTTGRFIRNLPVPPETTERTKLEAYLPQERVSVPCAMHWRVRSVCAAARRSV